jgi:hypothetical protein
MRAIRITSVKVTFEADGIYARVQRRSNSKRKDAPYVRFLKQYIRKAIETDFSQIKTKMLRCIHAVTKEGFQLKVALFVIAFAFYQLA